MIIHAKLSNYSEPVEVTSIDFKNRTFTWNYRGHLENVEAIEDAEFIIPEQEEKLKDLTEYVKRMEETIADQIQEIAEQNEEICRFQDLLGGEEFE